MDHSDTPREKQKNAKPSYRAALHKTEKHSVRVQGLRRLLPIISGVLILGVILWVSLDSFFEQKIEGIPKVSEKISLLNKVENPSFHMADKDGNPVRIQADSGTQKSDTTATLTSPSADFVGPEGEQVSIKADKAFMDQETKKFVYEGNVHFKSDQGARAGFDVKTDKITADLKTRHIESQTPVVAVSPLGRLDAPQGFSFKGDTQILTFIGKTHLVITQPENGINVDIVASDGIACDLVAYTCKAKGNVVTTQKSLVGNASGHTTKITSHTLTASFDKAAGAASLKTLEAKANGTESGVKTQKRVRITHGVLGFKASAGAILYETGLQQSQGGTLTLRGKPVLRQGANTLYAGRKLTIHEQDLRANVTGRSTLKMADKLLQADRMTLRFKKNIEGRLTMNRLDVSRNVKLSTAQEFVTADKGVYYAGIKVAELFGKVRIKRDMGTVEGQYAKFDMVTGQSQLKSQLKNQTNAKSTKAATDARERVRLVLEPLKKK